MAVGFGIGMLGYYLWDDLAGHPTETIIRDIVRTFENRPIFILIGPWKVENFGFFSIAEVFLKVTKPILVQPKGPYISYLNPNDNTEILMVEVVSANDNATEFFEGRESLLVPMSILKPCIK